MKKRHYKDLEPRMSYDSKPKRERKQMAWGCLWSLILIVLIIVLAFWWRKESAFAMTQVVVPHVIHNQVILN